LICCAVEQFFKEVVMGFGDSGMKGIGWGAIQLLLAAGVAAIVTISLQVTTITIKPSSAPTVTSNGNAVLYVDQNTKRLMISTNGNA
jgi:hypothetical protein